MCLKTIIFIEETGWESSLEQYKEGWFTHNVVKLLRQHAHEWELIKLAKEVRFTFVFLLITFSLMSTNKKYI